MSLFQYLKSNTIIGLKKYPKVFDQFFILSTIIFSLLALIIIIISESSLFNFQPRISGMPIYIPLTTFFFPSFFEELFFRGVLIPIATKTKSTKNILFYIFLSSVCFTIWHPLNAATINKNAQEYFFDPVFLLIVFLLGCATSIVYIFQKSIWSAVLIHWFCVLTWLYVLGGRNLVLEI